MRAHSLNLLGLTVMVRSDLTDDPSGRRGEIGRIVSFFPEKEIITVNFGSGFQGVYSPEKLLRLKSKKLVLRALTSELISGCDDCKIVLKVYKLISIKRYRRALKYGTINNTVGFYCTVTCRDWIDNHKT